jgi:hypothetical protein
MHPALETNAAANETCRYEPYEDIQDLGRHRPPPHVAMKL